VLVGFRTPQHMQGINVAGYHEHFITDDRQGRPSAGLSAGERRAHLW
jgi:alpha-acetolactate decarboxylase